VGGLTLDEFLAGAKPEAAALFHRFQELVEECGDSELVVNASIVYWRRNRIFAGAFCKGHRLELNVDLTREAEHPCLLVAFPHTQRVFTHRLRIEEESQLDDALAALLAESWREVGPGFLRKTPETART
jgi:hypothetical protein